MKTNVKLLIALSMMATACTTGIKVTSGGYSDDLYYTPGDATPAASKPAPAPETRKPQPKSTVVMQVEENEQGKVVNNYVVPKGSRKDNNAYYFDDQPTASDTTLEYKDNKEQVTVNNYYEGEEMSYTTRIRTVYNPYFYDPYWDPFWSPYYGSLYSYGWGMGGFYPGWGMGYYDPWNPYFGFGYGFGLGFGWGGFYPGWGWGGGYYGGYEFGHNGNRYAGIQNNTGRRGQSNAVRYNLNTNKNGLLSGSSAVNRIGRNQTSSTRSSIGNPVSGSAAGTRQTASGTNAAATRLSGNQRINGALQSQANTNLQQNRASRGATVANLRRSTTNIQGSVLNNASSNSPRTATSGSYTPTYNRPRTNTAPSYNNGATRQYGTPQTNSSTIRYARPQGSVSGSVRTQSSGYQRGSVNSSTRSSGVYSSPAGSSSSRSVQSSATRSYSAPSFSGGTSGGSVSGGGNSGGGNSGGGGSRSSGRTR